MRIPIIVVAYNRVISLGRLLTSLNCAEYPSQDIELIISIDHGNNKDVLDFAERFQWLHGTKTVLYRQENMGLKRHILSCGDLSQNYDAVIMLEDDLYVSRMFYQYAVAACQFVKDDPRIGGVSLYNHKMNLITREQFEPLYDGYDNWYFQYASSWGQLWTKDQWSAFKNWYTENENYDFQNAAVIPQNIKLWGKHSWLKYYIAYLIETNRFFLYPRIARTTNYTEAGTNHKAHDTDYQVSLDYTVSGKLGSCHFANLDESQAVYDAFFENTKLETHLKLDAVCVDLYGVKQHFADKQYLLTTAQVEGGTAIRSFGRDLRPHDLNVIESIAGGTITLYKVDPTLKKVKQDLVHSKKNAAYFFTGLSYGNKRTITVMFLQETLEKIKRKIRNLVK